LPESFTTDSKRLQQILKNLLSNAFKFTDHGEVAMTVHRVTEGWSSDHPILGSPPRWCGGIRRDRYGHRHCREKQKSSSRRSIRPMPGPAGCTAAPVWASPSVASCGTAGGEIQLTSAPGKGSTFTLYLPLEYAGPIRPTTSTARDPAESAAFLRRRC